MTDEIILQAATLELKQLTAPKLWMTARALSRRLRKKHCELRNLSQVRLFDVLFSHAESIERPRKIRNSPYPSMETLEVLWGAIDGKRLMERKVELPTLQVNGVDPNALMAITAESCLSDGETSEQLDFPPSLFFSYNFQDTEAAKGIVDILELKSHSVWMAGVQIAAGEFINDEVIKAMKQAGGHLLYLSDNALKSLWVGKEILVGETMNLPLTIVVNGADEDLMGLVRHWISGGESSTFGKLNEYEGVSFDVARQFQEILKKYLMDSNKNIYLFPSAPDEDSFNNERILSISELPDAEMLY